MSSGMFLSGWRYKTIVLSVIFSAIGYLGVSLWGGWDGVISAFGKVGVFGILAALLMSSINYILRFLRWSMYLRVLGQDIPWESNLKIYLAGFAMTTTPGRAGEALRGVLLKPWGVPYTKSFAAFFSERLSDLIAIFGMTLFGLSQYSDAKNIILGGGGLIIIGLVLLSNPKLIIKVVNVASDRYRMPLKFFRHLCDVLAEAQRCHRPIILIGATLLGVLACSAEAIAFYWILNWLGGDISLPFAIFVYATALLAGALSFLPGGLGGTEAVMVGLLIAKGMPHTDAIAATILIRLCTLWFSTTVGVGALINSKQNPSAA